MLNAPYSTNTIREQPNLLINPSTCNPTIEHDP
jgi:hypothetical protein